MTTTSLLIAVSVAGCALYVGDGDDIDPVPAPPPSEPQPAPDPEPWRPDPEPSPSVIQLGIPLSPSVRQQARYLEITGIDTEAAPYHRILSIPLDASTLAVTTDPAQLLSLSLHTASGQLIDAALAGGLCPDTEMGRAGRILEVPVDYETVATAIEASEPGDIVYLHPGTYTEHIRLRSGIRLIGAGAGRTILDGQGGSRSLIDFSGARDVVIRGFTLRNVGQAPDCTNAADPFECAGDAYAAAIHGTGREPNELDIGCPDTSAVIAHNVFEGNDIGVLLHFHAPAVIRNNLFIDNSRALTGNELRDNTLVVNNTFVDSKASALADQQGFLDLVNNIITGAPLGLAYEYEEYFPNDAACNVFFDNAYNGDYVIIDGDRNFEADPMYRDPAALDYRLAADSPFIGRDCFAVPEQNIITAPGAYGGFAGGWYEQPIDLADLAGLFGL